MTAIRSEALARRRRRVSGGGLWTALAAPGTLLLLLLFIVPTGLLIAYSFATADVLARPTFARGVTLHNYALVFTDYNIPVLVRTLVYSVLATLVCLVVGYAIAYFAARFAGRHGLLVVGLVMVPWLVNYLVRIYGWRSLLAEKGLFNDVGALFGLPQTSFLGTDAVVILGLVYGYLPLMVLPIYSALGQLNSEVIDAGKDLYGGRLATFWHVTLPYTREGVVGGIMLVFLPVLGDFATAQFLGGPNTSMIGNLIANQFTSSGTQPVGAAITVVLVIGLVLAVLLARVAGRRRALAGGAA